MLAVCSWNRRDVLAVIAGLVSLTACAAAGQPDGPWSRAASMPNARSELTSALLDGQIYAAGGIAQFGATTAFAVYDPQADAWEELPPLPEDLHHLGAAAAAGRIYLTGGYGDIAFSEISPRTWAYDPGARRWTQAADMPAPRAAHAMAAIADRLYVVGGVGPRFEELWVYDPGTDRWHASGPPLPTPREHLSAAVIDGRLHVVGGRGHGFGNRATLEIYDPAAEAWQQAPGMPTARGGLTAAAQGGRPPRHRRRRPGYRRDLRRARGLRSRDGSLEHRATHAHGAPRPDLAGRG